MLYKPDWEATQERFLAWWAGQVMDRVAMSVTAPNGQVVRPVTPPEDPWRLHGDPEYHVQRCESGFAATHYAAEAFPCMTLLIGYAFLGTPATFTPRTIWLHPVIEDPWRDLPVFDMANPGWQRMAAVVRTLVEAGRDRWVTTFPTVPTPTDLLSGLRGNQRLCVDMLDRPEWVTLALDYLTGIWTRAYGELGVMLETRERGSSAWLPLWSPGRSITLQCDFSCMISAEMFRRFVVPEQQALARWLDNCIYHLDGPGAIHHLDALLEVPEIKGIQWVPGAGQPPPLDWLPLLRRIQSAGKLLHISIAAADVERALEELRPEGLLIATGCASVQEADDLVRLALKRTSGRK